MRKPCLPGLGLAVSLVALASAANAAPPAQSPAQGPPSWRSCCGVSPWPQGGMMGGDGMMGGGMMQGGQHGGMMGGSMRRHHVAMAGGVPEPYTHLSNPLPQTGATVERGAAVYAANCASCHGATGVGDGPAAQGLNPRPANLAWLSTMPMSRWDPYMYWTIAEGGRAIGTAMPAFKDNLSKDDIWAVIGYVQAHLPPPAARR